MAYDRKIVIEFDQDLTNTFSALTYQVGDNNIAPSGTAFGSSQWDTTNYNYAKAFDRSISTYWWASSTTAPQWVGVNFGSVKKIARLKVYLNGNVPNAFILQGSNDGTTYTDIYSGNFANSVGWQTFDFTPADFQYWRIYCTSKYSTYFIIYEIELYEAVLKGNQNGFIITQAEKQANVTTTTNLTVYSVEKIASNKIQLNINPYTRIKTSEQIAVAYSATSGNLTGLAGSVQDFSLTFIPSNIVNAPHSWNKESLSAGISGLDVHTHLITYKNGYETEHLSVGLSNLSVVVTFVGTANP
jgi:F5/8 type C domain.